MFTRNRKLLLSIAIALVVVVISVIGITQLLRWLNSGIIKIHTPNDVSVTSVQYCQAICETSQDTTISVPKGNYLLQVGLSNGGIYTTSVTVEGSQKEANVQVAATTYPLSVLVATSRQNTLPAGNSYVTYEPNGLITTGDNMPALGVQNAVTAQYIDDHRIVIVSTGSEEGGQPIVLYDTTTGISNIISRNTNISRFSTMAHNSQALYFADTKAESPAFLKISDRVETIPIPNTVSYVKSGAGYPTFAVVGQTLALLSSETPGQASASVNKPIIDLYSLPSFTKKASVKVETTGTIYGLSLSPDASRVAVLADEDYSGVYDATNGNQIFKMYAGGDVYWRDNDSFFYTPNLDIRNNLYPSGSILLADLKTASSYTIIDSRVIKNANISLLKDNKLYLTGSALDPAAQSGERTTSYVVDLTKASPNTPLANSPIIKRLPYDGLTYTLDYTTNDKAETTLRVDTYSGYRNAAVGSIYTLGFDPADYTITFKDYTNPFGEGK